MDWVAWAIEIFSQLWSVAVWDQGAGMINFWWELSSQLIEGYHLAASAHEREEENKISGFSSHKSTDPTRPGPHLYTSQRSHLQKHWGLELQHSVHSSKYMTKTFISHGKILFYECHENGVAICCYIIAWQIWRTEPEQISYSSASIHQNWITQDYKRRVRVLKKIQASTTNE